MPASFACAAYAHGPQPLPLPSDPTDLPDSPVKRDAGDRRNTGQPVKLVRPAKPVNGRRLRVFVVEDSALTVENLSALLEQLCNAVVVGSAGDEASAVERIRCELASQELDLLIVDVFLRDGTGLGVLAQLAQRDCRVPRVMLSNYAKPEIRQACLALGADRFFDKSTDVDELVEYCQTLHARLPA